MSKRLHLIMTLATLVAALLAACGAPDHLAPNGQGLALANTAGHEGRIHPLLMGLQLMGGRLLAGQQSP